MKNSNATEYHNLKSADTGQEHFGRSRGGMGEENKEQRQKKNKRGMFLFLQILQHIMLALVIISLFVTVVGSQVRIQGLNHYVNYDLYAEDKDKQYEESELFNNIFGYSLADIVRLGVISSQLETDGKFDGNKIVDVTAYNYREERLPKQYVTAEYYLEDLLKWNGHGFETTGMNTTKEQFLANKTRVTSVDESSRYYNTSDANYLKSDISQYTHVSEVPSDKIHIDTVEEDNGQDGFVEDYQEADYANEPVIIEENTDTVYEEGSEEDYHVILINRYKTVEGKNLEEYVSDWDLYNDLLYNLETAAENLSYNYNEYLRGKDYYSTDRSNMRYLIQKQVDGKTQYYTNLQDNADIAAVSAAMKDNKGFDNSGLPAEKYLYYSPADMVYETNTEISKNTILKLLSGYDYAYPENVKIWLGVDTSYPVKDSFTQGAAGFQNYMPYYWQWLAVACVAGVVYLVLLCYLTWRTGREVDEEGRKYIRLSRFDKVPTEAAIAISFGFAFVCVWFIYIMNNITGIASMDMDAMLQQNANQIEIKAALGLLVFLLDAIVMFFFYSLVRRIKARTLWSNSLLCRLWKRIKKFAWHVYDNGGMVLRIWLPYGIFLLFNGLMVLWMMATDNVFPLLVAVVMDVIIGILLYRDAAERQEIVQGIETIAAGELNHQVDEENLHGDNLILARSVNSIGKGIQEAVEISMKDERMKADLITNVSHDIKTPLTSIVNYVDLIKREDVDNEKIRSYIKVLDEKSQRLKQLTDDLVEASKISSGNINLHFERINLTELMNQTIGEFSEKFEQKNLTTVMNVNAGYVVIEADSRRIWRVMENLFNNVFKYALEGTRVYIAIEQHDDENERIKLSIKNISATALNCNPQELTERFIRGDVSRTTEGSGLGLSIAKNLTEAQGGTFEIILDGDLFKVIMTFPLAKEQTEEA